MAEFNPEARETNDVERRTHTIELRVDAPGLGKTTSTIRGYAAKFNSLSEAMPVRDERGVVIGTFRELLLPGCFAAALPNCDVRSLINHDPNLILGRTASGTLRLSEDEVGLRFEIDPPETSYSKDIQISMQRGDISQCSFGFNVATGGDTYSKDPNVDKGWIRTIRSISKLYDASPVTYPAYLNTNCAVRSIIEGIKTSEDEVTAAAAIKAEEERSLIVAKEKAELELLERM